MKPILFSTPMVQAILADRKTMTRRVCKFTMKPGQNPNFSGYSVGEYCTGVIESGAVLYSRRGDMGWTQVSERAMPRYLPGDILWTRETWAYLGTDEENNPCFAYKAGSPHLQNNMYVKWRPSIFMPREAARIFLRVTNVRVERVQDITPYNAWREGCRIGNSFPWEQHIPELQRQCRDIVFRQLWDALNSKRGYGWDANPWVWIYEFERISKEEALSDGKPA